MSDNTVKDTRGVDSGGAGAAAGYVDVLPLVTQADAFNNAIQPATLYRLPYSRVQGGRAALVTDPVIGDIGLAVYTKRDSSGVAAGQTEPVKPASFRSFNQADGFYIGGFLNQQPEVFLELTQDGKAVLTAPLSVTVNTVKADINAGAECNINAPVTKISGELIVSGGITGGGGASMTGGLANTGGTITSNGITLEMHVHGGVLPGGSDTEGPK